VEHDEWAVLEHGRDVRATPALRCGVDQRLSLVRVGDYSRGGRNVSDDGLFQVHDDTRVGGDVIDPVSGPVRAWHPADEQDAILLVQEDLYPPALSRPSSGRRQIDDLTTKQRSADAVIHRSSSIAHANIIAVGGPEAPRGRQIVATQAPVHHSRAVDLRDHLKQRLPADKVLCASHGPHALYRTSLARTS